MPRPTPWQDEYTLLCERCGYVIEGLDEAGACPECGMPVADSLPQRRVGTPWQQKPGVRSLVRTWWMTLRHPIRTLDIARVDAPNGTRLAGWTCLPTLVAWPVFMGLTWIEARGLRFFSRQRGGRITPAIAWMIVGHAAVGWLVLTIGVGIGLAILKAAITETIRYHQYADAGRLQDYDPTRAEFLGNASLIVIAMSVLVGFLFFETFAWLGLRRCKFVNRVRPPACDPRPSGSA